MLPDTASLSATCVSWRRGQRRAEDGTKAGRGWGWGREVLCDERGLVGESYLPLGRSPSSFLQRTVGTGSPRASHLNSTAWSTNTTWLPGRRTKLGRSAGKKTARQIKNHRGHNSCMLLIKGSLHQFYTLKSEGLVAYYCICEKISSIKPFVAPDEA